MFSTASSEKQKKKKKRSLKPEDPSVQDLCRKLKRFHLSKKFRSKPTPAPVPQWVKQTQFINAWMFVETVLAVFFFAGVIMRCQAPPQHQGLFFSRQHLSLYHHLHLVSCYFFLINLLLKILMFDISNLMSKWVIYLLWFSTAKKEPEKEEIRSKKKERRRSLKPEDPRVKDLCRKLKRLHLSKEHRSKPKPAPVSQWVKQTLSIYKYQMFEKKYLQYFSCICRCHCLVSSSSSKPLLQPVTFIFKSPSAFGKVQ